jgi:hypothetical protein
VQFHSAGHSSAAQELPTRSFRDPRLEQLPNETRGQRLGAEVTLRAELHGRMHSGKKKPVRHATTVEEAMRGVGERRRVG